MIWKSVLGAALVGAILSLNLEQCPAEDDDTPDITPTPTPLPDDLGYACDISFPTLPNAPEVQRSFMALPTSNGYISATYAIELYGVPVTFADGTTGTMDPAHRLISFSDHVMAKPTPTSTTRDLLYDLYLGLRLDGAGTWLGDVEETSAAYVPGTGIIRLVQEVGDIEIETYIFAPFQGDTYSLVVLGHVTNQGSSSHSVDLYSLQNFHTGGEGSANNEAVSAVGDSGVVETRGGDRLYHRAIETPSHASAAPAGDPVNNPWMALTAGQDLSDRLVSGDDVAVGFQWTPEGGTLAPGAESWQGFVVGFNGAGESDSALTARVDNFLDSRTSAEILQAEESFWEDFHAVENPPPLLSGDEAAVYRQSTAVLKMGQVREDGPGYGQILASLPPGGWNISWPRDAAYAIVGLVRSGHLEEARDGLEFMLNGRAGDYASYLGLDDYLISVCRYYGDGQEESDEAWCPDGSSAGPNIELDDFGLFLWAYGEYLSASDDNAFKIETLNTVLSGVADPLVALIDSQYNLLQADSSIWERHWDDCFPNGKKHFTYSSLQAANGLRIAAELSESSSYSTAADTLLEGLRNLQGGPVIEATFNGEACPLLASAPEETCPSCGPFDASVIEVINLEVINPTSSLARGTLRGIMAYLSMGNGSPGFLRNDDGASSSSPWYDEQEWVVMDLRVASAMARMGEDLQNPVLVANARTLVDWITLQARANADLIGELLSDGEYTSEDDADFTNPGHDSGYEYQGSVPMCGFGPGAYILALEDVVGR